MTTFSPTLSPPPWRWFEFREPPRPASAARTFTADFWHHVYQVQVDGQTIPFKYFRQPSPTPRPTLLLLHGMGLTIATFRGLFPYLFPTHDLVMPDYSGFSLDNSHRSSHVSLNAYASSVWRIADALDIPKLSLAGNSLGGGLSLMATLMAPPRVECLLLSNPACFPQKLPTMYRLAKVPLLGELLMATAAPEKLIAGVEFISYVDKSRFDPALRGLYTESLSNRRNRLCLMNIMRQLPANARDTAAARHLRQLNDIRQPVLLTYGLQDPLLAPGSGERMAAALPNLTYEPYKDLAHMPHEEAPDRIGPRWAEFLNVHANQP